MEMIKRVKDDKEQLKEKFSRFVDHVYDKGNDTTVLVMEIPNELHERLEKVAEHDHKKVSDVMMALAFASLPMIEKAHKMMDEKKESPEEFLAGLLAKKLIRELKDELI